MNPTYGAFFQDNWALSRKLTLNLGLRYDLETGTTNTDMPSPIQPGERPTDTDNIAPRFGFAYDLHGDGRTRHPRRRRPLLRQGDAEPDQQRAPARFSVQLISVTIVESRASPIRSAAAPIEDFKSHERFRPT